jgi:hypothetical protein
MKASPKQIEAIEHFVKCAQRKVDAEYSQYTTFKQGGPKLQIVYGSRFAKIVKNGSGVYCFIEIATGDIYKAATWAAPAKHVRGNINAVDSGMSAVTAYGANYLR